MSLEPHEPREVAEQGQGLGYPTAEVPTYRKVAAHPEPAQQTASWPGSTGELPVTGAPAAAAPQRPRGPYVPTIVRGLFVLALAAVAFVWRLADDPNWAVVGITLGVCAGAVLLLAAVTSLVLRRVQRERDFDRMLSGS
ncbi:hypothetical protein [Flexivirga oryzae]|uniref:Uncharacterized protein n=1 Tax=Flexivirga oryzae TaxID=1794944 RepID=A0A839N4D6_9MICO|nr:hypothetical protein [Flexivirga oryzae]MBB2892598.1 hypothetical protein [Flexivirga oryzae]